MTRPISIDDDNDIADNRVNDIGDNINNLTYNQQSITEQQDVYQDGYCSNNNGNDDDNDDDADTNLFIVNKIKQQYLPQLRQQIRRQVYNQLQQTKKQLLLQKTTQIKEHYESKLQADIQAINKTIQSQLLELKQQINRLRVESKNVQNIRLSEQEQSEIVDNIVQQMSTDEQTVQQLRNKLHSKIQKEVDEELRDKLEEQLGEYRVKLQERSRVSIGQWQEQRIIYWREQSENELQRLAEEYEVLENKKRMIGEMLQTKKQERDSIRDKYQQLCSTNQEIASIKAQIKLLKNN